MKYLRWIIATLAVNHFIAYKVSGEKMHDPKQFLERTSFQIASPFDPKVDLKSDVAIVYGFGGNVVERIKGWRDQGYRVHLMTGVAWGVIRIISMASGMAIIMRTRHKRTNMVIQSYMGQTSPMFLRQKHLGSICASA